jgi:hypothetical protein
MVQGTNISPIPQGKGDKKNYYFSNILTINLLLTDIASDSFSINKRTRNHAEDAVKSFA